DDLEQILDKLVALINAGNGDPLVLATPNKTLLQLVLTARESGEPGNNVELTTKTNNSATIAITANGATLAGGMDAAKIAPGTIVTILGDDMSDETAAVPYGAPTLPTTLAGVRVYVDGMEAPLLYVSPGQINAQVPWETNYETTSVSVYVRTERKDGRVTVTTPTGAPIIAQNPGMFAAGGA
ncbi:MAG: IPT/TIG domain-containing protein, partial [Acidobacteria bacterium]|nr:IPT/TIG domain-containing protein [Acidobacteriota bacterium]